MAQRPTLIEFFAGGGGVAAGAVDAGVEPIIAVEFDPGKPKLSHAIADCHQINFPGCAVIRKTVQDCAIEGFKGFPLFPDLLWASPVCSNFSVAKNPSLAGEATEDIESAVATAEGIKALQPHHFLLENVPAHASSTSWLGIKATLEQNGYWVEESIVNMADYDIPQARKRFIVRAARNGLPIALPPIQTPLSWYEAVEDLIEGLPDSELLLGQQQSLNEWLMANAPLPLLVGRTGARNEYPVTPAYRPSRTILRSHFTDHKGANRNRFADIWLPDGRVKAVSIECIKRLQGFPDWYKLPESVAIAGSILGYAVPPKFVELMLKPWVATWQQSASPVSPSPHPLVWGADGVGRGNCAGLNIWAVVGVPEGLALPGVKDSKATKAHQRANLVQVIRSSCVVGLGTATPREIDELGIDQAEELALSRAIAFVQAQGHQPSEVMGDLKMPPAQVSTQRIKSADAMYLETSAASVVGKHALDLYWARVAQYYPNYGFTTHAGYVKPVHMSAIEQHGLIADIHRRSYKPCKPAALQISQESETLPISGAMDCADYLAQYLRIGKKIKARHSS